MLVIENTHKKTANRNAYYINGGNNETCRNIASQLYTTRV